MNQHFANTSHRTIRAVAVVSVSVTAATLCMLNAGCSMRGQKLSLWPQASAKAGSSDASLTDLAEKPTAEVATEAMAEQQQPISLASFDRPADGDAVQSPFGYEAAPAPEPTATHATAPVVDSHEITSSAMPVSHSRVPANRPPAGEVLTANSDTFDQLVVDSDVPVLVDFYADWCGPCRALSPKLHELAREVPDVRVVKVDIDESPDIAARYQVSSIPAIRVFDEGKVTARHRGLTSKKHLKKLLGQ